MKITGYIVQSGNAVYGPFQDAGECGRWLVVHITNIAGPASIVPMIEPFPIRDQLTADQIKNMRLQPMPPLGWDR